MSNPALSATRKTAGPNFQMNGNNQDHRQGTFAKLECSSRNESLGKGEAEEGNPARALIRVTSVRTRLIDEDNLCEKYHVDACRYAGLLHSDDPGQTQIKVSQRKAKKGEPEEVIIEITR